MASQEVNVPVVAATTAATPVSVVSHGALQNEALGKKDKEDVNILILGETGVGKSTWINAIANYVKHNTLKDAMEDPDFTILIPARFTFTDKEGEERDIAFGNDANEVLSSGQSATQGPQEHTIETETARFHLIDTPGIGDCRGIEQDKENFENILNFLTNYEKINAVVVLLKPNNARLTVAFRFCVLDLLTHLHKSVVSNIIFAFTNSRGTFYRPGDSLPVLKKLLKQYDIEIDLSPSNYFCFDNEAFRFLACNKSKIEFTSEEVDLYSKSWDKSCKTTDDLFSLVKTKQPHETKETIRRQEDRTASQEVNVPVVAATTAATPDGVDSHGALQNKALGKKDKEDVNILILGETGVGKSTWINAIANYAKHNTLKDAMEDPDFTVLIPSRFTFTDEEGEERDIAFGNDANEVLSSGQSATQGPQEHTIESDTARFHLIDTPGIGDCRGIEQDKENFEKILTFLTNYDKINAVVVLLKPNNARLTVAFRFCVLELMTHLHKSVVSNMVFAFTNSRGTFYRPGETLPVLKKLLKEQKIAVNFSPSKYFCLDNEAFRFLACHKSGIRFTPEEVDLYSMSWVKSCETTRQLFDLVKTLQPHETKKTLSLNEARSCLVAISKPMGQSVQLIEINVKKIKEVKEECSVAGADIESFQKRLKFKAMDLELKELPYPITVCAAEGCKKHVEVGRSGVRNTIYPVVCHDHCHLSEVSVETMNNERLRRCRAMSKSGVCKTCKHSYKFHMHITYTATLVEKEFLSEDAQKKIREKADVKSQNEALIAELERMIKELKNEKKIIYDSASVFGVFLKENAMIPYNDSFSDYLDMLISDEENKPEKDKDLKKIAKMKKEKKEYEEKKNVIDRNIASGTQDKNEVTSIEKVDELRRKLCALPHNGTTLNTALGGVISARKRQHTHQLKKSNYVRAKSFIFEKITYAYNYVTGN